MGESLAFSVAPVPPEWPVPQSEYKVTLVAAPVVSVWPMVHICEFSHADLPYPASLAGADPPSPPDQCQSILRIRELCVLAYPTPPRCSILSSVLEVLSADEWSTEDPLDDRGSSASEGELSDSSVEHSRDASPGEEGGSDLDGF